MSTREFLNRFCDERGLNASQRRQVLQNAEHIWGAIDDPKPAPGPDSRQKSVGDWSLRGVWGAADQGEVDVRRARRGLLRMARFATLTNPLYEGMEVWL